MIGRWTESAPFSLPLVNGASHISLSPGQSMDGATCAISHTAIRWCGRPRTRSRPVSRRTAKARPSLFTEDARLRREKRAPGDRQTCPDQPDDTCLVGLGNGGRAVTFSTRRSTGRPSARRQIGRRSYVPLYAYAGARNIRAASARRTVGARTSVPARVGPSWCRHGSAGAFERNDERSLDWLRHFAGAEISARASFFIAKTQREGH